MIIWEQVIRLLKSPLPAQLEQGDEEGDLHRTATISEHPPCMVLIVWNDTHTLSQLYTSSFRNEERLHTHTHTHTHTYIYKDSAKSCPTLAIPWTVACQAHLSMGFSRQEYWSGLPFPSSGELPYQKIEPRSPTSQAEALLTELHKKPRQGPNVYFRGLYLWFPLEKETAIHSSILAWRISWHFPTR